MTPEVLVAIMPRCPPPRLEPCAAHLTAAMAEADCTTVVRAAAFLAQIAHETGQLRWLEELSAGFVYEGRRDLGNTEVGDGARYKGRGYLQVTGRKNYRAAGEALGLPLEEQPELAMDLDVGARVAAWYWRTRNLNDLADLRDFRSITEAINGRSSEGPPSYHVKRVEFYRVALEVLGLTAVAA